MTLRWATFLLVSMLLSPTATGCNASEGAYCDSVTNWPEDRVAWEARMLELFNEARAAGADCGSNGYYDPTGPLTLNTALRCASRVHSKDMHDHEFFEHTNLQGEGPSDRFERAGWTGGGWGENIIAGYGSAENAFGGWMSSDGHCANIMNPSFNQVGIGYFNGPKGYGDYGTAGFGSN